MKLVERLVNLKQGNLSQDDREVVNDALTFIGEARVYLEAASESTMSRNNSENLALELIDMIDS